MLPRMSHPARALALLALFAVVSACSAPAPRHDPPLPEVAPAATIELGLRDIAFSTQSLEVAAEQIVDLHLANAGQLEHDFTVERMPSDAVVLGPQAAAHQEHEGHYAVHAAPRPGDTVTVRLHPHAAGTYLYYCTVKGHREAGMSGTIVVS